MSDLRGNSIAGAVLASVLGIMGVGVLADALISTHYPEQAGYLPEVDLTATGGGSSEPEGPPDFGRLFADAATLEDLIARGETVHRQCLSCHTFDAGGANGTGPNLHDVFGRDIASHAGFSYTEAMLAEEGRWDYLRLNDYLRSPQTDVRGTAMVFAGLRNDRDRTAMIAYLRSISPNNIPLPAPLPEPEPETADGEAAPADGATTTEAAPG